MTYLLEEGGFSRASMGRNTGAYRYIAGVYRCIQVHGTRVEVYREDTTDLCGTS